MTAWLVRLSLMFASLRRRTREVEYNSMSL